jgi:hypothetical protein
MRYDNILWVVAAPGLASCACFAFETFCNFAESWNDQFASIRHGFEMIGGKSKRWNIHVLSQHVAVTTYPETSVLLADQKAHSLDGNRA